MWQGQQRARRHRVRSRPQSRSSPVMGKTGTAEVKKHHKDARTTRTSRSGTRTRRTRGSRAGRRPRIPSSRSSCSSSTAAPAARSRGRSRSSILDGYFTARSSPTAAARRHAGGEAGSAMKGLGLQLPRATHRRVALAAVPRRGRLAADPHDPRAVRDRPAEPLLGDARRAPPARSSRRRCSGWSSARSRSSSRR